MNAPRLARSYQLKDYKNATSANPPLQWVFVEAEVDEEYSDYETKTVMEMDDPALGAVVPWCPMIDGTTPSQLANYLDKVLAYKPHESNPNRKIVGVRYLLEKLDDLSIYSSDTFIACLNLLPKYNLHFEITVNGQRNPAQWHAMLAMVETASQDVLFILDHSGKPPIQVLKASDSTTQITQSPSFMHWRTTMEKLSAKKNVVGCKISGLLSCCPQPLSANIQETIPWLVPFVRVLIDLFGVDRILFGGDWPMLDNIQVNGSGKVTWSEWVTVITECLRQECHLSDQNLEKFFSSNARNLYHLV